MGPWNQINEISLRGTKLGRELSTTFKLSLGSSCSKKMFLLAIKIITLLRVHRIEVDAFASHFHKSHGALFPNAKKCQWNQLRRSQRWITHGKMKIPDDGDSLSSTPTKNSLKSISPETISAIKTYADILTVIESYNLPLFSSDGSRGKCLCPFHNDNNPSLQIDKAKGIYKCFSCGAGGDVFNFVREYDHIQNGGEKMSYPAAIVKVATEFVGGSIADEVTRTLAPRGLHLKLTPAQREKMEHDRKRKQKLMLINSAAAEYYASCLIRSPKAGGARLHIYNRKLPTNLIRTFAIGYAPDAFFKNDETKWGEGSLVEHLRNNYDFSPQEIIDAGLATVTTQAKNRLKMTRVESEVTQTIDYPDLMDRFRNRLMIPIFDDTGQNVLGFGGRHIDYSNISKTQSTTFTEAKYLNTAETAIFSKKELLFSLCHAKSAIQILEKNWVQSIDSDEKRFVPFNKNKPIASMIIVEGYFDAITLYGAGVKEVTASMGTALTQTQLKKAVEALGAPGKVFLCLDNDEAGQSAIERICSASWIWDFVQENRVDLQICTLPAESKDPAEFIEQNFNGNSTSVGYLFRDIVLKESVAWNEWYITRIASKYDPGDAHSFSSVCDKISTFLSTHPNPAERTRRAYETAGILATLITKDTNRPDGPLKLQLESDLLHMSSRKAAAREAFARRIESVDGATSAVKQKIRTLSSGDDMISPASGKVRDVVPLDMESNGIKLDRTIKDKSEDNMQSKDVSYLRYRETSGVRRSKDNLSNRPTEKPVMTPHFSGFRFSKSDSEWLGDKVCIHFIFCTFTSVSHCNFVSYNLN